jgi:hypothetical protein
MTKTQSVILNLNKEYSNSKAHDFFQPVAQKLDIGKNAEVSLYNLSLSRKPLYLESNTDSNEVDFVINFEYFPSTEQKHQITDSSTIIDENQLVVLNNKALYDIEDIDFKLKPGGYTIRELSDRITMNVNSVIKQGINGLDLKKGDGTTDFSVGGVDAVISIPYSYIYDKENFYLGLAGCPFSPNTVGGNTYNVNDEYLYSAINNTQDLGVFGVDNNESTGTADIITETESLSVLRGKTFITSNTAIISQSDYQSSFNRISDSPIFPLFKLDNPKLQNNKFQQTQSFFEFDVHLDTSAPAYDVDMVVGFTNTYLQSKWTNTNIPEVSVIKPSGESLPDVFMGARFVETKSLGNIDESRIDLYVPNIINEHLNYISGNADLDVIFGEGLQKLTTINLGSDTLARQGKFGFRFVAHTNQADCFPTLQRQATSNNQGNDSYYSRTYSFQFYARPNLVGDTILYDSCDDNIYFPANLIEAGFLFGSAKSGRTVGEFNALGFMPYLFVKNLPALSGISNPRGNYILQKDFDSNSVNYRCGINFYNYKIKNTTLNEILGLEAERDNILQYETKNKFKVFYSQDSIDFRTHKNPGLKRYDPNAYPQYKKDGGIVKLYADNTQYNIELNLPIKAYNTTQPIKKTNDKTFVSNLGQKRTILYKSSPIIQGQSDGINQTFVNLFKEPNNLKFLTLNNSTPLNLNELNIQIRRAKTNELATELEDASVELLIKSE